MYNFIKISEKMFDVLMKIILFIPICIFIPINFLLDKYEKYRLKKGYSIRTIKRYIKYCDDYYTENFNEKLFVLDNSFSEYENYFNLNDFVNKIRPDFIQKKVSKIYYSASRENFIQELNKYYEPKLLTEEELKQEFIRGDGKVSFWYDSIKDKKVVKF